MAPTPRASSAELGIRLADANQLDVDTLYRLLRLRSDVFVVEQACPYAELDGRDLEPKARHGWIEEGGEVVCCLRLLADLDGTFRIGRLATARRARRRGLARRLFAHALASCPRPVALDAQSYLTGFYAQFGFSVSGPEFLWDGILHTPMLLR